MWCDPRNGSAATFLRSLEDLGKLSGHPELATIPWALWGHSGGGHWVGGMTLMHPQRVAAVWLRSGVPLVKANPDRPDIKPHALTEDALTVPMMCNLGTKEGVSVTEGRFARVWPANQTFFQAVRGEGGLVAVAVDPLTAHECGNQRYLAIPWLDACLSLRLPKRAGMPLRAMPTAEAWLADPTATEAFPASKYDGKPSQAGWLPNAFVARLWMQYVKDTNVLDASPPPTPVGLRIEGNALRWQAEADLESGIAHFIVERDGKFLSAVPANAVNRFGRPIFQGLQYSDTPTQPLVKMQFIDPKPVASAPHAYRVIAVNTAGLRSKPAEPAEQQDDK
jgi:pimeloyl-ACP methyl ester carboxylesterase